MSWEFDAYVFKAYIKNTVFDIKLRLEKNLAALEPPLRCSRRPQGWPQRTTAAAHTATPLSPFTSLPPERPPRGSQGWRRWGLLPRPLLPPRFFPLPISKASSVREVPMPAAGATGQWGSDPPRIRPDLASLERIGAPSVREVEGSSDNLEP